MIYGKSNAINYNNQKIIKLHQGISPIYNNYINNASKNNNNSNMMNTYAYQKENKNKKNQYLTSNSVSKTTKNSPRNIFYQYNYFNNKYKNNNNTNQHIKYETNINSPRKSFLKKVNFKTKKLNLNVKTLNMNLEINKYNNNDYSDNEDFNIKNLNNRNLSVINTIKHDNNDNSFIFQNNKTKNEMTKVQVNNLRNQLDKILSSKNRSKSNNKNNISNNNYIEKNEFEDNSIFTNENSFVYDNYTLTENNKNNKKKNKCILLKDKKIKKNIYLNKKEKKKRNDLNIKLFNSLKNNFIGIKLPNKKNDRNENIENLFKNKFRNRNEKNGELRTSKTQIDIDNDSSSIIKIPKRIKKVKRELNNLGYEYNKNVNKSVSLNKVFSTNSIRTKNNENSIHSKGYRETIENNKKFVFNNDEINENKNKKYEELENKYEMLLQSCQTLKDENKNVLEENKSLKKANSIYSEENTFLNNYIISIKKIVATIIETYSEQIQNLTKIAKNFLINSKTEYNDKVKKIKDTIDKYSLEELEKNKRTYSLIRQLIEENKILRKILINKNPDKNYFLEEKQGFFDKDHKLNFNYDFLKNLNKIDKDFEKKLYLNISFNNNMNKNNSVKKKIKKEKYYETDINYAKEINYKENNKIFEKKKIKYTKNKK